MYCYMQYEVYCLVNAKDLTWEMSCPLKVATTTMSQLQQGAKEAFKLT